MKTLPHPRLRAALLPLLGAWLALTLPGFRALADESPTAAATSDVTSAIEASPDATEPAAIDEQSASSPAPAPASAPDTVEESDVVEPSDTPSTPEPAPTPARTERHYTRVNEIVSIMNDSHLRADESAPAVVTVMGNAVIDGRVDGECVTVLGNVTVTGRIRGELVCVLGTVTLGPDAVIEGELVAVGGRVDAAPTAQIRGEKVAITIPVISSGMGWIGDWFRDGLRQLRILPHNHAWAWGLAGFFLVLNLFVALVFRGSVDQTMRALETRPVLCFVNGALVFMLFPVLLLLLTASVVGMLIVPVVLVAKVLCVFIGTVGIYTYCGTQFGIRGHPVIAMLAGNVVFVLLYAVPVIGLAVWCMTGLLGLGAAFTAITTGRKRNGRAAAPAAQPAPTVSAAPAAPPASAMRFVDPTPPVVHSVSTEIPPMVPRAESGFSASGGGAAATAAVPPPDAGWSSPTPPLPTSLPPLPLDEEVERATFWPRLGALALDFLFVGVACGMLDIGGSPMLLLVVAYHVAFWTWRSTTPGGIVFNLRIVRLDRTPMTVGVALVRALGGIFSLVPAGLGFIWSSFDDERQAWHDKLAGTAVVRTRRAPTLV